MAAADRCAGDKDRATRCRPHARAGVQACRGARASSSKIPVVERRGWRPGPYTSAKQKMPGAARGGGEDEAVQADRR